MPRDFCGNSLQSIPRIFFLALASLLFSFSRGLFPLLPKLLQVFRALLRRHLLLALNRDPDLFHDVRDWRAW